MVELREHTDSRAFRLRRDIDFEPVAVVTLVLRRCFSFAHFLVCLAGVRFAEQADIMHSYLFAISTERLAEITGYLPLDFVKPVRRG